MKCANEFSNTNTPSYLETDKLSKSDIVQLAISQVVA